MKLFNNPEQKKSAAAFFIVSAAFIITGFSESLVCGATVLLSCAALFAVFYFTERRRYKSINSLSAEINKILRGNATLFSTEYYEGELALLYNEIYKVTLKLREQSEKLEKDKIFLADSIADISHQLRTPLTSINLIVSSLKRPNLEEIRKRELLAELSSLLGRIESLVSSLLKMSRIDANAVVFRRDRLPLRELLRVSSEPFLITAELRGQTLSVKAQDDGFVYGDLQWLSEAVGNIIKNCTEHTPEGGTIHVSAEENPLFSEIIVSDTGKGISKADLPHIFERFYRSSDSASNGGVGIGLALAKMIVTEQNGIIKAENRRGGGALFTIKLYKKSGEA